MNIGILSNEYPPYNYGGAGVHVEYLTRELSRLDNGTHHVQVFCFGDQSSQSPTLSVRGVKAPISVPAHDPRHVKFFDTILRDIVMAGALPGIDVVHCHTWYSHFAGCLVKQLQRVPLVLTTHSLEPHRPWKVEQLGTAYHASSWIEKTAYQNADGVVAVSNSMKRDVHELYGVPHDNIRVIHNGIDLDEYKPTPKPEIMARFKIDPAKPYVLFVGRITRQKGIIHLVNAIKHLRNGVQVVLCAGAPDTKEIAAEMAHAVARARHDSIHDIIWIEEMLPRADIIPLYTHAAVFACPSVYEPFGIINLEAMACATPVVASAVGGIPEIVIPGQTGLLVPFTPAGPTNFEPSDPVQFARDLAMSINSLLAQPDQLRIMGQYARRRVEEHFSWTAIARETLNFYSALIARRATSDGKTSA